VLVSESRFLRACRHESVDCTPVWFMRQAGRALPEYRSIRGDGSILDAIQKPDLATEITLQPVRRYGVDAAILYSDIMVSAYAVGFGVEITPGVGPVVNDPFSTLDDLQRLRPLEPEEDIPYVLETVRSLTKELAVPLIGFTGAPFTIASYLIEGRPTRSWEKTKAVMKEDPSLWNSLMERLSQHAIATLSAQLSNGANAVQLFDSWIGAIDLAEFDVLVKPHLMNIISELQTRHDSPMIYFGTNTAHLLSSLDVLNADVIGVDWRIPINKAWDRVGRSHGIQGNLDPSLCAESYEAAAQGALDILGQIDNQNGHIFNLGHGVLPDTDPSVLERLVELVHEETRR